VELNPDVPAEFQQGLDLMGRFDIDKSIEDITASIAALRAQNCRKVGAMGHCLGGKLAFLTAARTDSDATAAYYAVGLDDMLGEAASIKKPFLIHIAARDRFVPPESQAKIHAALQGKPNVEVYDYDADHAFARHHGASRVPALADIADKRTREFFAKHLR
jgi:carboxymethylenebutenolidase